MKLYPIYQMVSYDIVFVYAIKFIFQIGIKHISPTDVILSTSLFALFMVIMQVPATILMDKIGYKKGAILANAFNVLYVILIRISNNLPLLIFTEFISCICFSLKEIADPSLLDNSIPKTTKKRRIFSKIEGKGIN